MLKVAIVTNNYKPYSGGLVSSIDSFASVLRSKGHQVYIITLDFLGDGQNEENLYKISCPLRFTYKKNIMAIPWRPYSQVHKILRDLSPDIIHSQHPFLLGSSALKSAKKLNIPIVFTYHTRYDLYSHYIPLPSTFVKKVVNKLAFSFCKGNQGIVVPSQSIYNFLSDAKINVPTKIIPSGILPIFSSHDFELRETDVPFRLLTVSRFAQEKNIPFLLEVFSKVKQNNFTFTLLGYGAYLPFLKNYAYNKLGLSKDRVIFIEKLTKEEIAQYYKQSDLFIFASTTETQGLVLAEAMAGGTPVVALNASGSSDIINNGVNGYLVDDVPSMVERINFIHNNSEVFKNLQHGAYQTSLDYNCENATNKLINFYLETIRNFK